MARAKIFLLTICFLSINLIKAQVPSRFYLQNPMLVNPSWVAQNKQPFLSAHYRGQWLGYKPTIDQNGVAPSSQLFTIMLPISSLISGVGLEVANFQKGLLNKTEIKLTGGIAKKTKIGIFSLGITPSFINQSVSKGFLPVDNSDKLIPVDRGNDTNFNLGVSVFWQNSSDYFSGISIANLLEPKFNFDTQAENAIKRNYTLLLGKKHMINQAISITPSVLIQTNFIETNFNISLVSNYKSKYLGGFSFSSAESIGILAGINVMKNKLTIGYSGDFVFNNSKAKSLISHEFLMIYKLEKFILGGQKTIKTPRFTY